LERRRWDRDTHPLTRLPGSLSIEEEVRKRLQHPGQPLGFAYFDIDHFKSFNDAYGYEAGDQVIKQLGELIMAAASGQPDQCLPAHIGGDDFVLIADPELLRAALPSVLGRFDELRMGHYRMDDRMRGGIEIKNRQGVKQFFPLIALSTAVVSNEKRVLSHYGQIVEIATEVKHYLKNRENQTRSAMFWDRRGETRPEAGS
jgi:diguanylate cyclase (GGDEF)-like protein